LAETGQGLWASLTGDRGASTIQAHEFHYARIENLPEGQTYAYCVQRGAGVDGEHDGLVIGNLLASFMHLRDLRDTPWVNAFVDFVRSKQ
jgi:cobyrinic acid a,c-diamide synthase